jgi:hypothetical protein
VEETREWGRDISFVCPRTMGGIRLVRSDRERERVRAREREAVSIPNSREFVDYAS